VVFPGAAGNACPPHCKVPLDVSTVIVFNGDCDMVAGAAFVSIDPN